MEHFPRHFPFIQDCLKKFEYPNIHSLDHLEIIDIFSNTNRQFLVSWILKQIDDGYSELVENASKEDLAEILYQNGFCGNSQKIQFINGECDSTTQWKILYRMFRLMENLSDKENRDEMKPLSENELQDFLDFDTNLFPVYGNKQTLNSAQRAKKIKEYQQEIEYLKNLTAKERSKEIEQCIPSPDPDLKNELSCNMRKLDTNVPNFKRNILKLIETQNANGHKIIKFKENFTEMLETSNTQAAVVANFIQNMNVIHNFKENNVDVESSVDGNKSRTILRQISGLCSDVATSKLG